MYAISITLLLSWKGLDEEAAGTAKAKTYIEEQRPNFRKSKEDRLSQNVQKIATLPPPSSLQKLHNAPDKFNELAGKAKLSIQDMNFASSFIATTLSQQNGQRPAAVLNMTVDEAENGLWYKSEVISWRYIH